MTFRTTTMYQVGCDYPGCGNRDDEGEYAWWDDPQTAIDQACSGGDWKQEAEAVDDTHDRRIFCGVHRYRWRSDEIPEPDAEDAMLIDLPTGETVVLA